MQDLDSISSVTPVKVTGVIRGSEKPCIFVPENDSGSSQWFYVDVPAIAHACGLPEDTHYVEDINENVNPSNPYPIPKDVNTLIRSSVMPQDHLNYTLTWYALCFIFLIYCFVDEHSIYTHDVLGFFPRWIPLIAIVNFRKHDHLYLNKKDDRAIRLTANFVET